VSDAYQPSVGDIVKATPPRERARLCRVTGVLGDSDGGIDAVQVVNRTPLTVVGPHDQHGVIRTLPLDLIEPATLRQKTVVEEWEASAAFASLRATMRRSGAGRRSGRR
jgi:hypothetical protein